MAQVLVTESYLDDIADAIRDKNGSEDTYTPAEMADAIEGIHTADEVVLVSKSVTANGTYNPASDSADGYSGVTVNVPNTYTASDNGKVVVNQALTDQTSKSISTNGTHDTTENNSVVVDVPNSYAAADEGKVVSQGSLVTQTSKNITENGTHDTTTNNEVVVNVSATPVLYIFRDPDYVMDETGVICTIAGRVYTKTYSDPALVAYYYNGGYTGPILLSKTENGAKYSANGGTSTSSIITIDGEQWYLSSDFYSMSGDLSKSAGFAQKLSGTYSTVDAAAEALYLISQTAINANGSYNIPSGYDGFHNFVVDVPNTYTQSDEGKVVSNGALVSQGSWTITENGTYDTTLISSLTANISGGGGGESIKGFITCFADYAGGPRNGLCALDNKYFSCFFHDNMSATYKLNGNSYSFLTGSGNNTQTKGATKETDNNTDTSENSIISKGSTFSTSHTDSGSYISVGGGWVGYPSGGTIYENMNTGTTNSITMNKAHKTLLIFVGASQRSSVISTIDINGDTYNIKNNGTKYDNVYGEYGAIEIDNNSDTTITVTFPNSCWSYLSIVGID